MSAFAGKMSLDAATEAMDVASSFASEIRDRIIIVTGVNAKGLGFSTAEAFASQHPRLLILAGRNQEKVQECISILSAGYPDVKCLFLHLDLSNLASVRSAARSLLSNPGIPHINLLINNAGIGNPNPDRQLSTNHIELHFAINHIGHFLFTNLLVPKLITASQHEARGATRIVNLTSGGHFYSAIRFSDLNFTLPPSQLPQTEKPDISKIQYLQPDAFASSSQAYHPFAAYGQSKTANILLSLSLTQKLYAKHGILSYAVNPGAVLTELMRDIPEEIFKGMLEKWEAMGEKHKSLGQGSSTTLRCAVDPGLEVPKAGKGGEWELVYWSDCQPAKAESYAVQSEAADRLWKISEDLVAERFEY